MTQNPEVGTTVRLHILEGTINGMVEVPVRVLRVNEDGTLDVHLMQSADYVVYGVRHREAARAKGEYAVWSADVLNSAVNPKQETQDPAMGGQAA